MNFTGTARHFGRGRAPQLSPKHSSRDKWSHRVNFSGGTAHSVPDRRDWRDLCELAVHGWLLLWSAGSDPVPVQGWDAFFLWFYIWPFF